MDYLKGKYYFLEANYGTVRRGVENAAMYRARLFKNKLNIIPVICTAEYNPRLGIQRKKLVESGLLDSDIKIINLYEFFQENNLDESIEKNRPWESNDNWVYEAIENSSNFKLFDKNNKLKVVCDEDGIEMNNTIYINNKRMRREVFDLNGYLSKAQYFDQITGQVNVEEYYRTDGTICIHKYYEIKKDKNTISAIHLIDRMNNIQKIFPSEMGLIRYWIEQILSPDCNNFLIIDRPSMYYEALRNMNYKNVFKICMIRSKHYNKVTKKYNVNGYRLMCEDLLKLDEDITKPDAVTVMTNRQKLDLIEQCGSEDYLYVIPNSIDKTIPRVNFDDRLPLRAIYLAAYTPEKQHKNLIKVFQRVIMEHPTARLDLFGAGKEKDAIIKLILKLNLENNIIVHDFTDDVGKIYDTASLAVLTSKFEGFSNFLLESISHGCPVVSYDIEYGPSDLIDDNINGFLVEPNNEEEMARKINQLFSNQEKLEDMSRASYMKSEQFNSEIVVEKWINLFETVVLRKKDKKY